MSNVLILGCSLTMGSYIYDPGPDPLSPNMVDTLSSDEGWYHHISQLRHHDVQVISTSGGGYIDWAQKLVELEMQQLLQHISCVVIAETSPGRFGMWRKDHQWICVKSRINGIGVVCRRLLGEHQFIFSNNFAKMEDIWQRYGIKATDPLVDWFLSVAWCDSVSRMHDMSILIIKQLCNHYGVPIIVFSFFDKQMDADDHSITRLGQNLYDHILRKDDSYLTTLRHHDHMAHQTVLGNRALGEHLSEHWPAGRI